MAWAIGDDEITLSHVNRNALLALGLQAVDQQRQVNFLVGGVKFLTVFLNRREVIFKNQF